MQCSNAKRGWEPVTNISPHKRVWIISTSKFEKDSTFIIHYLFVQTFDEPNLEQRHIYIYIKILKQLPHRSPRENLTRGIQTPSVKVWAGSCAVWFLNEKWRVIGARISLVIDLEARRTVGILTRKSYGSGEKVSRSSPRIVFQIGQWHWSEYRVSALDIGSLAWDEQAKRDARPRSCTPPSLALSSPRFLPASAPMGGGRERILRRPLNRGETWIRWGGGGEEVGLRFRNVYVQLSWPQLRIVTRSSVWACSVSFSLSLCYDNE